MFIGQAFHAGPVHAHRVDVQVPVTQRGEDDCLSVRRQRSLGVVRRVGGQAARVRAVGVGGIDVVVVQCPHIAVRVVGTRRAGGTRVRGARVEDALVVIVEVAAGGAAETGRDAVRPAPVRAHDVHLIALLVGTLPLEDQEPPGRREIRFGVLPAECELAQVAKVNLSRVGRERPLRERDHQHQGQGHRTRKLEGIGSAGNQDSHSTPCPDARLKPRLGPFR